LAGNWRQNVKLDQILVRLWLLASLGVGCEGPVFQRPDWVRPRIVSTDIPASGLIDPAGAIRIAFSKAITLKQLGEDTIVLLPYRAGQSCSVDLACDSGRCHEGTCQWAGLDQAWGKDFAHPPLTDFRRQETVPLDFVYEGSSRTLTVRPRVPLLPHRRYQLLVSSAFKDTDDVPIALDDAEQDYWLAEFSTSAAAKGGPQVTLVSPQSGAVDVPPNLLRLVINISKPFFGLNRSNVWIKGAASGIIPLRVESSSPLCGDRERGTCYELALQGEMVPLDTVSLVVSKELSGGGVPSLQLDQTLQFATVDRVDRTAPAIVALHSFYADGCLVVRLQADEEVDTYLTMGDDLRSVGEAGKRTHDLALPLRAKAVLTSARLQLVDLAGNGVFAMIAPPPNALPPAVAISEVLANPAGPEPKQEFVELVNLSPHPVDLAGWTLDDGGDGQGVNTIHAAVVGHGEFAVLVGSAYQLGLAGDPTPRPGSPLIRLDKMLGQNGIANTGEVVVLRDAEGRLVSSYGGHVAKPVNGRSIERRPLDACDVPSAWRLNESNGSTPGGPPDDL
jgi:hypothetical protein